MSDKDVKEYILVLCLIFILLIGGLFYLIIKDTFFRKTDDKNISTNVTTKASNPFSDLKDNINDIIDSVKDEVDDLNKSELENVLTDKGEFSVYANELLGEESINKLKVISFDKGIYCFNLDLDDSDSSIKVKEGYSGKIVYSKDISEWLLYLSNDKYCFNGVNSGDITKFNETEDLLMVSYENKFGLKDDGTICNSNIKCSESEVNGTN